MITQVRKTGVTQKTITVETEHGETIRLEIVAENCDIYAVNYEENDLFKAGQFVDSRQELIESRYEDEFEGPDTLWMADTIGSDGSLRWAEIE